MVAALRDSFAHHQLLHQKCVPACLPAVPVCGVVGLTTVCVRACRYVLQLLHRFAETLDPSSHGNVLEVTVPVGTKLVVVGDVHGQLQVGGRLEHSNSGEAFSLTPHPMHARMYYTFSTHTVCQAAPIACVCVAVCGCVAVCVCVCVALCGSVWLCVALCGSV